jgi:hypothetical protein
LLINQQHMSDVLLKIAWGLFVLYSVYQTFQFVFKRFRLNIFSGSWHDLERVYLLRCPPGFVRFATTSARIGIAEYVDTIAIALDKEGVYFQRDFYLQQEHYLHPIRKTRFCRAHVFVLARHRTHHFHG